MCQGAHLKVAAAAIRWQHDVVDLIGSGFKPHTSHAKTYN